MNLLVDRVFPRARGSIYAFDSGIGSRGNKSRKKRSCLGIRCNGRTIHINGKTGIGGDKGIQKKSRQGWGKGGGSMVSGGVPATSTLVRMSLTNQSFWSSLSSIVRLWYVYE